MAEPALTIVKSEPLPTLTLADAPAVSAGTWEDRGIGGKVWHPADGATERNRADDTLLGMPPEFAAISGLAIGRAIGAPALTLAARAVAGIKAVAVQALPQVKYEVTKTALQTAGVPAPLAMAAAFAVSGYRKGAKTEPTPVAETSPPGVDRYMPNVSGITDPPVPPPAPPPAAPVAVPPTEFQAAQAARQTSSLPDQRSLNEAALAARRSAYAANQASAPAAAAAAAAGPIVAASGKMQLTAPEFTEFTRLSKRMPLPDALQAVLNARELAARLGGASAAEVAKAVAHRGTTGAW